MKQKSSFPWVCLILTILFTYPVFLFLFPKVSRTDQIFSDLILENVARSGFNKSGELGLFWCLLAAGIVLFGIFFYVSVRFSKPAGSYERNDAETEQAVSSVDITQDSKFKRFFLLRLAYLKFLPLLLLPNLAHFLIYREYNKGLLLLSAVYLIATLLKPVDAPSLLCVYVLSYYAVAGIFTILIRFLPDLPVRLSLYGYGAATVFAALYFLSQSQTLLKRIILYLQIPVTGVLGIWFVDRYRYRGDLITVRFAGGYYLFFGILTALFLIAQLDHLHRLKKEAFFAPLSRLISSATVMLLFAYNSFSACPMYAQPDQHHHGEQMIPWQQVFGLGQKLYEEYTPVSGLFPFSIGAIQNVLLGKTASDYSPAVSILMVIVCLFTMYLVYQHTGGLFALLFAVFFCLPCYNRQYLVLPFLLLLFLPSLRKRRFRWVLFWIFCCFLAGLYYPLFGAALLLGTFPFGIWQVYHILKEKTELKKPGNYGYLLLVLAPVIYCMPLLWKMLAHTMTYSSQTVLADGICLFGQTVPEKFMPYLGEHAYLQSLCYFALRFFLPLIGVWVFAGTALLFWKDSILTQNHANESFPVKAVLQKAVSNPHLLFALGGAITLCVSYTYTLVRADTDVLLSRTSYILCALAGIFLPVLLITWEDEKKKQDYKGGLSLPFGQILLIACLISLPMILYRNVADVKTPAMWVYPNGESELFLDDTAKIYDHYEVPEIFIKSEDTDLADHNKEMLGKGFIVSDQLSYIKHYQNVIDKCSAVKKDMYYMGFDGQGFYYFNDVKTCNTGFIQTAKGYPAQQKIIENAEKERPVVFLIEPDCDYYVYYWMHTHDYVYCAEDECFYPKELFGQLYPGKTPDDYREYSASLTFGKVPDSLGRSRKSLQSLFLAGNPLVPSCSRTDISLAQNTLPLINGKEYDMLALTLDTSRLIGIAENAGVSAPGSVTITFENKGGSLHDNNTVTCDIADGTLLIPMGMNPAWLLTEDIHDIRLTFDGQADSSIYADAVTEAVLYKLRQ